MRLLSCKWPLVNVSVSVYDYVSLCVGKYDAKYLYLGVCVWWGPIQKCPRHVNWWRHMTITSYLWRHNLQSRHIRKLGPTSIIHVDPLNTHYYRTLCLKNQLLLMMTTSNTGKRVLIVERHHHKQQKHRQHCMRFVHDIYQLVFQDSFDIWDQTVEFVDSFITVYFLFVVD